MSPVFSSPRPGEVQRIPAGQVAAFIEDIEKQAQAELLERQALNQERKAIAEAQQRVDKAKADLNARIEAEAQAIADRAKKLQAQQAEAQAAATALSQAAAIAQDYQSLELWLNDTILAGVETIIDSLPADIAWEGRIRKVLDQTAGRWTLSIHCHPDATADILRAVEMAGFKAGVSAIHADPEMNLETCILQADKASFELNLRTQIDALARALGDITQMDGAEGGQDATA